MTDVMALDTVAPDDGAVVIAPTALTLTLHDAVTSTVTVSSPGQPRPALGDNAKLPTVHRGLDASVNVLRLDATFDGITGALDGVELQITADESVLEGDFLASATIALPPGWTAVTDYDWFSGRPLLSLSASGAIVLDGSRYTATFELSNLPSGEGESGNGSLSVIPVGLPAPITTYALDLPVTAVNVNAGALVIDWRFDTTGEVIVTPQAANSAVLNTLVIVIANHDTTQPLIDPSMWDEQNWDPNHPPVFRIGLRCATTTPGYGALCTSAAFTANAPTLAVDSPKDDFNNSVLNTATAQAPFWSLSLNENAKDITTDGATVQISITGVASDLPLDAAGTPDPTVLTVAWQNLPGRLDSETALIITKTNRVAIDSVELDPSPPALLHRADPVTVTWNTRGASSSMLVGAGPPQPGPNDGAAGSNTAIVHPDPEHAIVQVLAFGRASATVPAAMSVPIEMAFADPVINAFTGTLLRAGSRTILDLSWDVDDAEYCTLSSSGGVRLETSVARHRIILSPERPLAGRYTLTAVAGATTVEATLVVMWEWDAAKVVIVSWIASNSPISIAQAALSMDALAGSAVTKALGSFVTPRLGPIILPPLGTVPPIPTAAAWSGDGETLYLAVTSTNGTALRALDPTTGIVGSDVTVSGVPAITVLGTLPRDGSLLATNGQAAWVLEPGSGAVLASWNTDGSFPHAAGQGWHSILAPQDGSVTLVCGCPQLHVETLAYDAEQGTLSEVSRVSLAQGVSPAPPALAVAGTDPEGSVIAAAQQLQSPGASRMLLHQPAPLNATSMKGTALPDPTPAAQRFAGTTALADATQYLLIEQGGASPAPVQCVAWSVDADGALLADPLLTDGAVAAVSAAPDRATIAAVVAPNQTSFELRMLRPSALVDKRSVPPLTIGFAYVVNSGDGTVSQYAIATDGTLSPLPGPAVSTAGSPITMAVSADGQSAWVANIGETVAQYTIAANGQLSPRVPATLPTGGTSQGQVRTMARSPDGQSLYVLSGSVDSLVAQFTIRPDGSLAPMSPPTVATIAGPQYLAVSPDGSRVYVASSYAYVIHQVGAGGALMGMGASNGFDDLFVQIVMSPDGRYAYAAYGDSQIGQFSIGSNGVLSALNPPTVACGPGFNRLAISPDGQSLYVTAMMGGVSQYAIGAGGLLTPLSPPAAPAGSGGTGVAVAPNGHFAYAANALDNTLSQYLVNADGTLTANGTVATGARPGTICLLAPQL